MVDIIQESCDDNVAATLSEETIPSLRILRRLVRFIDTGFWMTIDHADDLDAMWPKLTGLLFEHQLGHFLHACFAHQFEHVGRLYHKTIPKTSDTKINVIHINVKSLAMRTGRNKSAYWTFWGFPISCVRRRWLR